MMARLDLFWDNLISEHIYLKHTILKTIQCLFETLWYGISLCTSICLSQGLGAKMPGLSSSDRGNIKFT